MYDVKDEGNFEAYTLYFDKAFDEGINATQLIEMNLGSKDLGTR